MGEKKKKNPIKRFLMTIIILVVIAAAIIGFTKGAPYVAHKQDPEFNNLVKLEYEKIVNFDYMVTDMFVGLLGEKGNEIAGKYIYPIMEKLYVKEDAPVLGSEEVSTVLAGKETYTIEHEDYLKEYQGRKVRLVGTITLLKEGNVYFSPGVEYDSADMSAGEIPPEKSFHLNCNYIADQSLVYENSVVEIEGFLTVGLYPPFDETWTTWPFMHEIFVGEMKAADFVALGGDPSELYMHQKAESTIHVEQDGFVIDILGVVVDAKTGDATVRFTYSKTPMEFQDEEMIERVEVVGIKGSKMSNKTGGYGVFDSRTMNGSVVIDDVWDASKEWAIVANGLNDRVGISDDVISLYFVGHVHGDGSYGQEEYREMIVYTTQVDIPSSEWTVYE